MDTKVQQSFQDGYNTDGDGWMKLKKSWENTTFLKFSIMPFGFSTKTISLITSTLAANRSVIKLVLFDSRAKGNPKPGSDIDIAVSGTGLSMDDFMNLSIQIDWLELAQKVDIIDYQK